MKIFEPLTAADKQNIIALTMKELEVVRNLNLPELPKYYEFVTDAIWTRSDGRQQPITYLLMEYVKGVALLDYLNTVGGLEENYMRYIFHKIILALHKLHKSSIAHRDIKPENIMIDSDCNLKLVDLGFASILQGSKWDGLMRTKVGTPGYIAPEIIEGKAYQGASIDIFSVGVTMLIMRTMAYPFNQAATHDKDYMML